MRRSSRSVWIQILLLLVLAYYLAASAGVDYVHNHEQDADFHDDCPACQWHAVYQVDFSDANRILEILGDPLQLIGYKPGIQPFVLAIESCGFPNPSRAPPESA